MNRIFTIFLLFLSFIVIAQSNFVAGSITKLNGETVEGKIDYREWVIAPQEIHFRINDTGNVGTYTVKDLLNFKINNNNEIYQRAVVGINREPIEGDEMVRFESENELNLVLKLDIDTVFLLTLVKGRVNLYILNQEDKQHYFIQKNNGRIEELIYRVVLVKDGMQTGVVRLSSRPQSIIPGIAYSSVTFEDYKKQLVEAMPDCPTIQSIINKATYSYSLKKLVQVYNECVGALTYMKTKDKSKSFFYGYIGAAQPFFQFKNANINNTRNLSSSLTPSFGLGFDIGIIRSLNKLSLGLEANYVAASTETSTRSTFFDSPAKTIYYTFDLNGVRLNALLKYIIFNGKIQPYVKAGIGTSSYFKVDYVKTETQEVAPFTSKTTRSNLLKSELHGILGMGLKVNNFLLESRYELGNDINRFTGEDLKMKRLSVVAGYALPLNKQ